MKTKTIIGIIAMLVACSVQTVNSQTYWELGTNSTSGESIGTFNAQPFIIKTFDDDRMIINQSGDVGIGTMTPAEKLDVDGNVNVSGDYMINGLSILKTPGGTNICVGDLAGENINGSQANTFVGNNAGQNQTISSGGENVFIGASSGQFSVISKLNTYVGVAAGQNNEEGIGNSIVGYLAGRDNLVSYNSFYGYRSGRLNEDGGFNSFFGSSSGNNNTSGSENVFIGANSGYNPNTLVGNTTGFNNVFLGFESGWTNTEGNNNTYLGHSALGTGTGGATLEFASAIGANAQVTASNCMVLGSTDPPIRVGIGIPEPKQKFHVHNVNENRGILVNTSLSSGIDNYGLFATAENSTDNSIGVHGIGGGNGVGFPFLGSQDFTYNMGVRGHAINGNINFGGIFEANQQNVLNFGIYASAPSIQVSLPPLFVLEFGWAGYFQGNVLRTGNDNFASDINLKDSIDNISNALSTLAAIQPKSFVFKTNEYEYMNLPHGKQFGFIAQQVDTVLPEIVSAFLQPPITDTSGALLMDTATFRAMNYSGLIPYLVAGVNELNEKKVAPASTPTTANVVPKWSPTTGSVLVNSLIYDNGTSVGIGTTSPTAKLDVLNDTEENAIYALSEGTESLQSGVVGESKNATDVNIGVMGKCVTTVAGGVSNVGLVGFGEGSPLENAGAIGLSEYTSSSSRNSGIVGRAEGSDFENYAGRFEADGTSGDNYGVYSRVASTGSGYYAAFFVGDAWSTSGNWTGSDRKLKNNIVDLDANEAIQFISRLNPKTYEFKRTDYPFMGLRNGVQYGLIADEVESILPELVSEALAPEVKDKQGNILQSKTNFKGINYIGLIPVLISALKGQQNIIDSLSNTIEQRLTALEQGMVNCCGANQRRANPATDDEATIKQISVELNPLQVIVLEQNVPNPFAEQTSISYYIPEDVQSAELLFFDINGRTIKTVNIETGYGMVTVFASNLSTGLYNYSLLIDGKVVETKKMMKTR